MQIHPEDLVLVAVLPDRRDLEIARVLGWYRIPVQSAPKTVDVDWIAFYLPATFGDEKWSVRYIAPVLGHELVIRRELLSDETDHPRANEPYLKIQLGELQKLRRQIPSGRWKRFTFLYTTGERLQQARSLSDLRIESAGERSLLWRSIREKEASSDRHGGDNHAVEGP
jgi:hypothetical protein